MKLERGKLRRQGVLLYLAAFSMIVVLIIAIMGGYLYRFYHRTIYENFVESNEADLGAIESRHENDMEIISNVVSQINLSADCTEFLLDKQPLKSTKLEEQLYRYTAVSFLDSYCIFIMEISICIILKHPLRLIILCGSDLYLKRRQSRSFQTCFVQRIIR